MEQRIYRMRCVEGWSMVVPWLGFPLRDFIARVQPTSQVRFVEFTTLCDPEQMPSQRTNVLPWPYTEGLRLDEAMHPLTLLATSECSRGSRCYRWRSRPRTAGCDGSMDSVAKSQARCSGLMYRYGAA